MPLDSVRRRLPQPTPQPPPAAKPTATVTANVISRVKGQADSGLPNRLNLKCVHADGKGRELTCTQVPSLDN